MVALREIRGGAGLRGLGSLPPCGWGSGRGARVVGRYGQAARDAGQLWDANPLESLALGS